ncbi:MAG: MMPL family transporter, partial [Brooklawnia sp.]
MMKRVATGVLRHSRLLLGVFGLLTIAGLLLIPQVHINFNLANYVPADAASTRATNVMAEEFDDSVPNVRVYVPNLSVVEAVEVKQQLQAIEAVETVIWLDDFIDLKQPLEVQDPDTVSGFYSNGGALFQISTSLDDAQVTMEQLQQIATPQGAVEGQLLDLAQAQSSTSEEISTIMFIMIPLALLLLVFSTRSWLDPLILLVTIIVAVVLNMGTNIFLGEISFLTAAVAGVLQMAVTMDYGIFLLHSRFRHLEAGAGRKGSIHAGMVESSSAVLASSTTTIFGFLALIFMRFRIGPDLGVVLAKGVVFSLICVFFLMPALMLQLDRAVMATSHRPLMPSFAGLGRGIARAAKPLLLIGLLLPICFVAQGMNDFRYGNTDYPAGSREAADREFIQAEFGRSLPMALLVPRGDWGREHQLEQELAALDAVSAITSYQTQGGRLIPAEVLPEDTLSSLMSSNYSRLVLTVDT